MQKFDVELTGKAEEIFKKLAEKNGGTIQQGIRAGLATGVSLMREALDLRRAGIEAKMSVIEKATGRVIKDIPLP